MAAEKFGGFIEVFNELRVCLALHHRSQACDFKAFIRNTKQKESVTGQENGSVVIVTSSSRNKCLENGVRRERSRYLRYIPL